MDFRLSDERRMLDESAARFLEAELPFKKYRESVASCQVFDHSRWQKIVDLGWMACAFPESAGGYGGTLVDAQLIARRMGERLSLDPWLSLVVVPGKLLEFLRNPDSKPCCPPSFAEIRALHWRVTNLLPIMMLSMRKHG